VHRKGDFPRLLRNHNGQGVSLLGHPEASPVTGTDFPPCLHPLGQGKDASGSDNLVLPNNHRSVMQGRVGKENGEEQLRRKKSVHQNTGLDEIPEAICPLKDDQCTDFLSRERLTRQSKVLDELHTTLFVGVPFKQDMMVQAVHVIPAQLRLENKQHCSHVNKKAQTPKKPELPQGKEIRDPRGDEKNYKRTDGQKKRGSLHPPEELIRKIVEYPYFHRVLQKAWEQETLSLRASKQEAQDGLLGMEPVLCFVNHHRMCSIDDLIGDLLSPVRRHTVHDDDLRRSKSK